MPSFYSSDWTEPKQTNVYVMGPSQWHHITTMRPFLSPRMSLQILRVVLHLLWDSSDSSDFSCCLPFSSWIWGSLCGNTAKLSDSSSCYGWAVHHNIISLPPIHYMVPRGHLCRALAVNTLHYKVFYFQAAKTHPNQFLLALWSSVPELVCCTSAVHFTEALA